VELIRKRKFWRKYWRKTSMPGDKSTGRNMLAFRKRQSSLACISSVSTKRRLDWWKVGGSSGRNSRHVASRLESMCVPCGQGGFV
jgi:hypothetical protein